MNPFKSFLNGESDLFTHPNRLKKINKPRLIDDFGFLILHYSNTGIAKNDPLVNSSFILRTFKLGNKVHNFRFRDDIEKVLKKESFENLLKLYTIMLKKYKLTPKE